MKPFIYKPGQILLLKRTHHDPFGSFIVNSQRITDVCHTAIVASDHPNPYLWTTGAHLINFGLSPLSEEMEGRHYYIAELESMTPDKLSKIFSTLSHFDGQPYGLHKVLLLMAKSNIPFTAEPSRLYPWLTPISKIRHPFCSESVAAAYWSAGINICQYYPDGTRWKEEPSAITPADIYLYACMKETKLNIVHEV